MKKNTTILGSFLFTLILLNSCGENKSNQLEAKENHTTAPVISRNPEPRLDVANVFWKKEYTLFDLITDEPIFPISKGGKTIYQIYYSSNEDPTPHFGEFTPEHLENHLFYKFKNKENCIKFCTTAPVISRNPELRLDVANVFWKKEYTLFDLITDEPIFPISKGGKTIYQIYYSSNEDPTPHFGEFTPEHLENHLFYKFKNKENCIKFCDSK